MRPAERDTLILLGHGRAALGVSLGTALPEERLTAAARWTGKALQVAERLGDPVFLAHAPRMHGNELRKADHPAAAIARLGRAIGIYNPFLGHSSITITSDTDTSVLPQVAQDAAEAAARLVPRAHARPHGLTSGSQSRRIWRRSPQADQLLNDKTAAHTR